MAKYKHIIWDWNGTVVNDVRLCVSVFNSMARVYGNGEITLQDYVENFKFPVIKFYQECGFDFTKVSFEEVGQWFINEYNSRRFECELNLGVLDALDEFSNNGLSQSVLSAYQKTMLLEAVNFYGIKKYFSIVDGLDDIYSNSKENLGRQHIAKIGINPNEVLMIGDTDHDKATADAMGVKCALVASGHNPLKRLEKLGVPVFENHIEFKNALINNEI